MVVMAMGSGGGGTTGSTVGCTVMRTPVSTICTLAVLGVQCTVVVVLVWVRVYGTPYKHTHPHQHHTTSHHNHTTVTACVLVVCLQYLQYS